MFGRDWAGPLADTSSECRGCSGSSCGNSPEASTSDWSSTQGSVPAHAPASPTHNSPTAPPMREPPLRADRRAPRTGPKHKAARAHGQGPVSPHQEPPKARACSAGTPLDGHRKAGGEATGEGSRKTGQRFPPGPQRLHGPLCWVRAPDPPDKRPRLRGLPRFYHAGGAGGSGFLPIPDQGGLPTNFSAVPELRLPAPAAAGPPGPPADL